jgi:acyl carrier protein
MTTQPDTDAPRLRERVTETICALLPDILQEEITGLCPDTELLAALGLTSTTALEVILRVEERLGLEISVEDLEREDFATIGTLADYIAAHLLPPEE